jgi:hypothetical protein
MDAVQSAPSGDPEEEERRRPGLAASGDPSKSPIAALGSVGFRRERQVPGAFVNSHYRPTTGRSLPAPNCWA